MVQIQRLLTTDPDQRLYFSRTELVELSEIAERGDGKGHPSGVSNPRNAASGRQITRRERSQARANAE
jgi:hypothetical protein